MRPSAPSFVALAVAAFFVLAPPALAGGIITEGDPKPSAGGGFFGAMLGSGADLTSLPGSDASGGTGLGDPADALEPPVGVGELPPGIGQPMACATTGGGRSGLPLASLLVLAALGLLRGRRR